MALPPFAPFPVAPAWRQHIPADQWTAALAAWRALVTAHLALPDAAFASTTLRDESLPPFLAAVVGDGRATVDDALRHGCFLLVARVFRSAQPPPARLLQWDFLADVCRTYGRHRAGRVLSGLSPAAAATAEASLSALKKQLVALMNDTKNANAIEDRLRRVNGLVGAWPPAGALLLAGDDFLDALGACFRAMHPPLRRCILTTAYLCLAGQAVGPSPRYALLADTLYALHSAAAAHRAGPRQAGDSLVGELVTVTPLLPLLKRRVVEAADAPPAAAARIRPVLDDLAQYRRPHTGLATFVPARRLAALARTHSKGKGKQRDGDAGEDPLPLPLPLPHAHTLRNITQVQDVFPDLGSGFVARLLDAYGDDPERVVAHLLEDDTLPAALATADRSEQLVSEAAAAFTPRVPPQAAPRRNAFDDDALDTLAADATAKLHFGKHAAATTADDVLRDRAAGPSKAAILSALATFDPDDDERDDTYDAADVGGAVETADDDDDDAETAAEAVDIGGEANEQALFAAYNAAPHTFAPDVQARRSPARARLRAATGLADDVIEAWGGLLARSPQQRQRLAATYWDNSTAGRGRGGGNRGGGRGGGRGGRGHGNVAGKPHDEGTEDARRRKEAHKGSRANHNRRDQRARKMGRGMA